MTVTVQLAPEIEANLVSLAQAEGMSLDTYLQSVLEHAALSRYRESVPIEGFDQGLDELAEGSERLPVLPAEAYSRESIYGDG